MSCEHCTEPDGFACFPVYGIGPHTHNEKRQTVQLPPDQWPENYQEDPDCPGMGVWWCPYCGDGKPADSLTPPPTAPKGS